MKTWILHALLAFCQLGTLTSQCLGDDAAVDLPRGVKAVWDLDRAWRETRPSGERICLNGLWRWQPADSNTEAVPAGQWGYFKVPGAWPGITDYMQKDCQTVFIHPSWKEWKPRDIRAAWYEREFTVPADWSGRKIILSAEYLNSFAIAYIDGQKAGELRFPAGTLDITSYCLPGRNSRISVLVQALPLKGGLMSWTDSASARKVKGSVNRRGLCGDIFLHGIRPGPRIEDVRIRTSTREGAIVLNTRFTGLAPELNYSIRTVIKDQDKTIATFENSSFKMNDLRNGILSIRHSWKPQKLWDIHTPQNQYEATLSLHDARGGLLDESAAQRFGFREFWIDGRYFYLNGSRIFLSAVPLDNAEVGAAWATYAAARESLERLKSFGINFVYTHNYGCEPGSHLSFEDVLRAADDTGMLVALSLPHFSHYEWNSPDADRTNGYAMHARFYAGVAGNHPSVVFYAMSHNATGYNEDMNPDMIDGIQEARDSWASKNVRLALRAEAIVREIDPRRIVYHHASGNLGSMHPVNFYPNFVPPQELSDWFGHWATEGIKPAFMCEYGAPFTWDWTMYRGWYKGQREFGSAMVPWEFCIAEWNAQFTGDRAYQISEAEKANLRWEAQQFRAGNLWHRWDYPYPAGSSVFEERYPVFALYLKDNWRAFRGWGVSGISPWEYEHFWKLRKGVRKEREELRTDWERLQHPGYSPDYIAERYERMDLAFGREDWIPTAAARTLLENNRPLLAFMAGKREAFTAKDHNFLPGETVEKQIIVINNSRERVRFKVEWSFEPPNLSGAASEQDLATGEQVRLPINLRLPGDLPPGKYALRAKIYFSTGETQEDALTIGVLSPRRAAAVPPRVALFDPAGETAQWLSQHGISYRRVHPADQLAETELLIVGKSALTVDGPAPDISRVRQGLKVIIFEQSSAVLEKRFGFRTTEYGLRQVFPRVPDHPLLAGLSVEELRDWRGAATILPPQLKYEMRPRYGPTVKWCDIPVTRLWRCGNRGNVASVLIEKPARGSFLPVADGGYALQYSPLLEYREGKGLVIFCQMDVTARSENDPAAETLLFNLLTYVSTWQAQPTRRAVYAGGADGRNYLKSIGVSAEDPIFGKAAAEDLLIIGPGKIENPDELRTEIAKLPGAGGRIVCIGLSEEAARALLPVKVAIRNEEHIAAFFDAPNRSSVFAGIAPADVHNRDPRRIPLVKSGIPLLGNGILACTGDQSIILCQIAPWEFEPRGQMNVKRTFRRAATVVSRILGNLGVQAETPILERFRSPADPQHEKRWLSGLYLDQPEEWDDPYRFFRW